MTDRARPGQLWRANFSVETMSHSWYTSDMYLVVRKLERDMWQVKIGEKIEEWADSYVGCELDELLVDVE